MLIACLLAVLPGTRRKVERDRCHEPILVVVLLVAVGGQLRGWVGWS